MTDDGIARIKSLRLELIAESMLARGLLPRTSRLFHQSLRGDLAALLNRWGTGRQWLLPKLELDLGVIPVAQFESEFVHRLLAELERALAAREGAASGAAEGVSTRLALDPGVMPEAQFESEFAHRLLAERECALVAREGAASGAAEGVSTQLALDMGVMSEAQVQPESPCRLTDETESELAAREGTVSVGAGGASTGEVLTTVTMTAVEDGHQASATLPVTDASLPADYASPPLMLFRQYLLSGYAAPQLRAALASGADSWLQAQLSTEPAAWRPLLAKLCLQPSALARLLTTFTPLGLSAIASIGLSVELHTAPSDPATWTAVLMLGALPNHSSPLPLPDIAAWRQLAPAWPTPSVSVTDASPVLHPLQATLVNVLRQLSPSPSPSQAAWLHLLGTLPNVCLWLNPRSEAACASLLSLGSESVQTPARYHPPQPAPDQRAEPLLVDNAGLLLLWPLLPGLFRRWGLLEEGRFIDVAAQTRAVCWLDAWLWQDERPAEWRTPLTKVLCGWPLGVPLHPWAELAPDARTGLDELLHDLPAQISGLHSCSPQDIRRWFLQRPGLLHWQEGRWQLQVEADACDVLLSALPWPINQPSLPWLAAPIDVRWF